MPLVAVAVSAVVVVAAVALAMAWATPVAEVATVPSTTTRPSDRDRASHVTSRDCGDGFGVGVSETGRDRSCGGDWRDHGHDRRNHHHQDPSPSGHPELDASNDNRVDPNAPLVAADRHEQLVVVGVVLSVVVAVEVPVLHNGFDNHAGVVVVVESAVAGVSTCDNLNCEYSVDNC